jgi:NADH-ubiquinone oxidoreductase chain 4
LFFIKFPVYFLHFWLPKAHVEAPTSARMLLAGLLLKLGTGGFLRLIFLLKYQFVGGAFFVALLGRFFCSIMCFFQRDLKALAALSSVNHMSFLLLLLLIQGGIFK